MKAAPSRQNASRDSDLDLWVPIPFIDNPEFDSIDDSDCESLLASETLAAASPTITAPADLPAHLRRICDAELLSPQQERALFREMNFLKFKAESIRQHLEFGEPDPEDVREIKRLLASSQDIREHLIQANTRLAISIVKKFVTPQQSFDEMLSDGLMILMQAVDKFDYDRGFRFSTYAYRSIVRHACRMVDSARREQLLLSSEVDQWTLDNSEERTSSSLSEQLWNQLRGLTHSMIDQLDRRERFIIRSRYALGSHRKAKTFQCLADKLGVSKERARQLEKRAVAKLQTMAEQYDVDEFAGAIAAT